ncbi:MAG: hypothetical protein LBT51_03600 [Fusobacteriaceae bacterium]|jgi:hypothetical protein|nr:hypothetical protein [Fusobacteriaceae bacterium]
MEKEKSNEKNEIKLKIKEEMVKGKNALELSKILPINIDYETENHEDETPDYEDIIDDKNASSLL